MAYIDEKDIYKLFENGCGIERLHVVKIDELPRVDAVEVKHGKWRKRGNEKTCSICEFIYYSNNDEWNYCPNCGAKMDAERKVSE